MNLFSKLKRKSGFYKQIERVYWQDFEICVEGHKYLDFTQEKADRDSLFKTIKANVLQDNEPRTESDILGAQPRLTQIKTKVNYERFLETFKGVDEILNNIVSFNDTSMFQSVPEVKILGREVGSNQLYQLISWNRRIEYIYLTFEIIGYDLEDGFREYTG
ncbi:hypothetical protein CKF54_00890 [Psittacicella hinzii]|uniref:Uncharacterized protein n=1 Tax=Psittacicella hinzii TaxID=2028575 RepID=A0A3A1YAS2_9GAMM|nr:hypothetical protein [Psittacicella hinzii]RIY34329.1 hypothetical protein CKF54_00890 [Psittacicella hinzii]